MSSTNPPRAFFRQKARAKRIVVVSDSGSSGTRRFEYCLKSNHLIIRVVVLRYSSSTSWSSEDPTSLSRLLLAFFDGCRIGCCSLAYRFVPQALGILPRFLVSQRGQLLGGVRKLPF